MKKGYLEFINYIINTKKKIAIFGVDRLEILLYCILKRENINTEMFIVNNYETEMTNYEGIPIYKFDDISDMLNDLVIIIAEENKKERKNKLDQILIHGGISVIQLDKELTDYVYENFSYDSSCEANLIHTIKEEKRIAIYGAGKLGKVILERFKKYKIEVEFFCVSKITGCAEVIDYVPVYSFNEVNQKLKEVVVVIAMENFLNQKNLIMPLINAGVKKIFLLNEKIIINIYLNYRKDFFNLCNGFSILENYKNIEINHSVVQYKKDGKLYQWRMSDKAGIPYSIETKKLFQLERMVEIFERQFMPCDFLGNTVEENIATLKPLSNVEVYMAKFHKDSNIEDYSLPDWIIPIQVGAALTSKSITKVQDDSKDNISHKNPDYSEGTALYWVWKNTNGQDYVGLFHYRRHMVFDHNTIKEIPKYDMVLTLPTMLTETVYTFFTDKFILKYDWELMLEGILKASEELYQTALQYEKLFFYFPSNIFIMKRQFFDEMCNFVFTVLDYVDQFYQYNHIIRKDRYLGYLLENLLSIYVMHNSSRLKLAYTDVKFYAKTE